MNILPIALHEIKLGFRDKRTFIFMLAFPIVLMLILGSALTNVFTNGVTLEPMSLLVKNDAAAPALVSSWNGFAGAIAQENVELVPLPAGTDGREAVQEDRYTAYAEIGDNGVRFYGSDKHSIESSVLQGMLTAFADKYNLAAAVLKTSPDQAQAVLADAGASGGIVRESQLDPDRRPNSIDYYAVVTTTMMAFYACMSASSLMTGERKRKTAIRLAASPASKGQIFAGKVIGCSAVNFVCILAVFLFSKLAFHADWGDRYGLILLVLLTEVMLAVSFGLGLSFLMRESSAGAVITIFIQIASFVGGAYFPVDVFGEGFNAIANISPMHWANKGLLNLIYLNDAANAWSAAGLNLVFSAALLSAAILIMRRREAF